VLNCKRQRQRAWKATEVPHHHYLWGMRGRSTRMRSRCRENKRRPIKRVQLQTRAFPALANSATA
jgi:hypothetical protein